MAETPVRFGILGCAEIARKLSRAIALAPNATVSAIGSRSYEKAKTFTAANGLPAEAKIYGSYEAVLDDPDVDAVYVPLPTSLHLQWAVLAAKKKKHLLLDKPVALNVKEFDEIIEACEFNGVQFMDATMWMHHPRTAKMKEFLSNMGPIEVVHSNFSYRCDSDFLNNNIRVKPDLDGLGVLGDAGWYCIRAILWANNYQLPKKVVASQGPIYNEAGVLLSCGSSLFFEVGRVATFHCSFLSNLTMDINIVATKGTLHVHDFVLPFQENEAPFLVTEEAGYKEVYHGLRQLQGKHSVTTDLPQEALMVKEFSRLVRDVKENGGSKVEKYWPSLSRKTQLIVDAVKCSIEKDCFPVEVVYV